MPIYFYSKATTYYELSNFHYSPFVLDNKTWPTVEHYFQAQKFPTDPTLQEKIRLASSPFVAKKLGRTKTLHFMASWEENKEGVMKKALTAKFTQNSALRDLLKGTGSEQLYENSPRDYYWGVGAAKTGKNRLGVLLMEIRETI